MNFGLTLRRELILDIGSSHTVVALRRRLPPVRVPSRIVLPALAGHLSFGTLGKPPGKGKRNTSTVVLPVKRGRVVHVFAMEQLLKTLLTRVIGRWRFLPVRNHGGLVVAPGLAVEEKSRLRALLIDVGFSKVKMIEAPLAAARGCGLPVKQARGMAVMDLGGGKFSLAVLSLGGIVVWHELPFGGQDLDQAIVEYIASRYGSQITRKMAEEIKWAIGTVFPPDKPLSISLVAKENKTDIPKTLRLEDNEIRDVLMDACEPLMQGLQHAFSTVPPELAGDIAEDGITLLGGGALLSGLPAFLHERTGLKFRVAEDPINTTLLGARSLLASGDSGGKD